MNEISKDELFRILSSSRRRYIIYFLHRAESEMELTDLATRIAAEENDREPDDVTDAERQRVYISLYQTHLPKLEEAGIVVYDESDRLVSLTRPMQQDGFFWMSSADDSPWTRYYLGLVAVGWLLVAAAAAGVLPMLSWTVVAVVVTLAFTALVVAQYLLERREADDADAVAALVE